MAKVTFFASSLDAIASPVRIIKRKQGWGNGQHKIPYFSVGDLNRNALLGLTHGKRKIKGLGWVWGIEIWARKNPQCPMPDALLPTSTNNLAT